MNVYKTDTASADGGPAHCIKARPRRKPRPTILYGLESETLRRIIWEEGWR